MLLAATVTMERTLRRASASTAEMASEPLSDQWRCYGLARRTSLVENDKTAVSSFRMNAACDIHKYFALAERVR